MFTSEVEDALSRRMRAKSEIDRLKAVVAACDAEIMVALDSEEDAFVQWAREVRGEIQSAEHRKVVWTDANGTRYTVSKRKGSAPRKTIVPEKLLSMGVPAHVIQAATTTGQPGKPGVSIRKVVGGFEGDDEE